MLKKRMVAGLCSAILLFGLLAGCESTGTTTEETAAALVEAMSTVNSCETSIMFELEARIGTSSSSDGHTASIKSDITVTSTREPFSYHGEYYSQILVDGARTSENQEFYIALEDGEYNLYEAQTEEEEWTRTTLTKAETLALPLKSGLIQDWSTFFTYFEQETEGETMNGCTVNGFYGEIPTNTIQELIGDKIFGSFLYSMEQLLNDTIPCMLYVDVETYLPVQLVLDFTEEFAVSDMIFESASITVSYSEWNEHSEIKVPKRVVITAYDPDAEFYASYFAWNLFLPYILGEQDNSSSSNHSGNISFISSWDTFQVRIDDGMTNLPLSYSDLKKLGYVIDDHYSSNILEANSIIENVPVYKNKDCIYCVFYNANTAPQPISDCAIGSIDVISSNIVQNGISVFLPGEVTLGISQETLISAYGEPDTKTTGFAADTLYWNGETGNQSFMAEVSPMTGQVIRIKLTNIPISNTSVNNTNDILTAEETPSSVSEASPETNLDSEN